MPGVRVPPSVPVPPAPGLECVVNVSEGRDDVALHTLATACGGVLADVHRDADHHRAVLTLAGPAPAVESAARALTAAAVANLHLDGHRGSHPRFGVVDVVPFVPLEAALDGRLRPPAALDAAVGARDRFARWAADTLGLPCFLYGPLPGGGARSLPEVRRGAFTGLAPDVGPAVPHPTAGACAVGARGFLVAYNLWLDDRPDGLALARTVAAEVRGPAVRTLGLDVGGRAQVSCNLVDPFAVGPEALYDEVRALLEPYGARIARCELVGLVPQAVRDAVTPVRRDLLDLDAGATVEARLAAGRGGAS